MAQPTSYNRQASFTTIQQEAPTSPLPGDSVDAELNAIKQTLDEVLQNMALIQRDDGELANESVGPDQLASSLNIGFDAPTQWATATSYGENDTVFANQKFYICEENHVSGTFSTDLADGKWREIADFTLIGGLFKATSTTEQAIETGTKSFTVEAGRYFSVNDGIILYADSSNYLVGRVASYSGTNLTVDVTIAEGSGTFSDWDVRLAWSIEHVESAAASAAAAAASEAAVAASAAAAATSETNAGLSADAAADSADAAAASAAAAAIGSTGASDRTELADMDPLVHPFAYLHESGREGIFIWDSGDNSANVTADPEEGLYVAPTSDPTGASGAWVRELTATKTVLPQWFGVALDGTSDVLSSWNALIAAINGGLAKAVIVPAVTLNFSAAPNAITASGISVFASGATFQMMSGAGTAGTFVTFGSSSTAALNNTWRGGIFECLNKTSLDGTKNTFFLENTSNTLIENVKCTNVNGFITYGTSATLARITRTAFIHIEQYAPAGGKGFDVVNASNFRNMYYLLTMLSPALGGQNTRGIRFKPTGGNVIDAGTWTGEINYPSTAADYCLEIDFTGGTVTNQMFISCVFDHAETACIYAHADSGAHASARTNCAFVNSRSTPDGGSSVLIDNTAAKLLTMTFNGGQMYANARGAVKVIGSTSAVNTLRITNMLMPDVTAAWGTSNLYVVGDSVYSDNSAGLIYRCGVRHTSRSSGTIADDIAANPTYWSAEPTSRGLINGASLEGLDVRDCFVATRDDGNFLTWFVVPSANANDFRVENNNLNGVVKGDVDLTNMTSSAGATQRIIRGNRASVQALSHRVTTTDATVTTLAQFTLLANTVYHGAAKVMAVRTDGTEARQTWGFRFQVYRAAAGSAVLGQVAQIFPVPTYYEGTATFDPANNADAVGETATVTVTGAALGDVVEAVSFSLDLQGYTVTAYVSAANTVKVRFQNESGGTLNLASGTLYVRVRSRATPSPNWSATIDVSGNTARLRVTGEAAATIRWDGAITELNMIQPT